MSSYLSPQFKYVIFHIYPLVFSTFFGYITKSQHDQLLAGLMAQLVEHCTGIAEVMGSNPVQAWIFHRLISQLHKLLIRHAFIPFHALERHDPSYIHLYFLTSARILRPHNATSAIWLDSSVGRALHPYPKGHWLEFLPSLNFFRTL